MLALSVTSPEIPFVEIDAVLFKELAILLLERSSLVMLLLLLNVFADGRNRGLAHGERAVSFLPRELNPFGFTDPFGRDALRLFDEIGDCMHRFDADEEVDVIGDASDFLRKRVEPFQTTTHVRMKIRSPRRID